MKLAVMNPRVAEVSMEAVFGHEVSPYIYMYVCLFTKPDKN
jgi:hypothetical protein